MLPIATTSACSQFLRRSYLFTAIEKVNPMMRNNSVRIAESTRPLSVRTFSAGAPFLFRRVSPRQVVKVRRANDVTNTRSGKSISLQVQFVPKQEYSSQRV